LISAVKLSCPEIRNGKKPKNNKRRKGKRKSGKPGNLLGSG